MNRYPLAKRKRPLEGEVLDAADSIVVDWRNSQNVEGVTMLYVGNRPPLYHPGQVDSAAKIIEPKEGE